MEAANSSQFLPVIQLAITPVILISGVGALMLTLTNRMGRIVDRTRALAEKVRGALGEERSHFESQLEILWRRAKLVRRAVMFAGVSMLLSCLLVMVIFFDALVRRDFGAELVVVFVASVLCLIAALVAFLRDIVVSLHALRLDVVRARTAK
jgi:ABC-type bacteriocin/lantibiotic exporter with double-glycine peptidase domain